MFDLIVVLIPGLPLLAAFANGVNALLGERYSRTVITRLAWGAALGSFLGTLYVLVRLLIDPTPREVTVYRWLFSGELNVNIAFLIDSLSVVMMLLTTSITFVMTFFSVNYMHNERGFSRFFTVMSLFLFAMLLLVMANNYVVLFLGWELVGMCSYLLIAFYCERPNAAQAGTRAFVMNRIGDAGFLMAIFLLFANFGTANFTEVFSRAGEIGPGTVAAITLCLLLAAVAKSGQLPLGTWLPRAMEGPTPSSALFYGSVMVTAGVYLIVRSHLLYDRAPNVLLLVAIVGAATALFAGMVSLVQTDIKNMLLATTNAQLGLMFLACGLGAYPVAVFHLAAHAYLKCYQFVTAPSILHLLHGGPDVTKTSSREKVSMISWLLLAGALALVIFPFLTGSLPASKFGSGVIQGFLVLLALGVIAAFSAAFNSARLAGVAFAEVGHNGHVRDPHQRSGLLFGKPMLVMAVIAVLALIGTAFGMLPGGINGTWFQQLLSPVVSANIGVPAGSPLLAIVLLILMSLLVAAGWLTPLYFDRFRLEEPAGSVSPLMRLLYNLTLNRFWLDELYDAAIVSPTSKLALLLDRFDREMLDRTTGVPVPAPRIRGVGQTWQEQFLALQTAASAEAEVATRWEESDERAALGEVPSDALGRLADRGSVTSNWIETTVLRRAAGGLAGGTVGMISGVSDRFEKQVIGSTESVFGKLIELAAGVSGWFEKRVIGRTENLFGRLTELAAGISSWFEKQVIGRVEDMFSSLTELAAEVSAGVENLVFQKGIQGGIPIAGHLLGRVLTQTEELLGHPLVIGLIFLFSIIALLVGAL